MKHKLKWRNSYETITFDTPDGDLGRNEYAVRSEGGWYVRKHPKNNAQFITTEDVEDIVGKTEVAITAMKTPENQDESLLSYYSEFQLPSGRKLRIKIPKQSYDGLRNIKGFPQPFKEVDDNEIAEIIKDDDLWQ